MASPDIRDTSAQLPQSPEARAEREEQRHHLILEALADVEAGRGLPQREVKAWAGRLGTDGTHSLLPRK